MYVLVSTEVQEGLRTVLDIPHSPICCGFVDTTGKVCYKVVKYVQNIDHMSEESKEDLSKTFLSQYKCTIYYNFFCFLNVQKMTEVEVKKYKKLTCKISNTGSDWI